MDGRTDSLTEVETDGRTHTQIGRRTDTMTVVQIDGRIDKWVDVQSEGRMYDRWTDDTDRWTNVQADGRTYTCRLMDLQTHMDGRVVQTYRVPLIDCLSSD